MLNLMNLNDAFNDFTNGIKALKNNEFLALKLFETLQGVIDDYIEGGKT